MFLIRFTFLDSKLLINEIQIKTQCSADHEVTNDVDLLLVLCQNENCCSIEALPTIGKTTFS